MPECSGERRSPHGKVLVVVEGESDRGVVSAIAGKLGVAVRIIKMRGNRLDKAVRLIRQYSDYDKAIVLKDLHCSTNTNSLEGWKG